VPASDVTILNGATGEVAYGARRVEEVLRDTWGHLDAKPGVNYPGTVLFAEGFYGDLVILDVDFGDAGDGPWFYEGINDWLIEQDTEPGKVYRFTGRYRLCKDDRHSL
jgi:hypothetical protein